MHTGPPVILQLGPGSGLPNVAAHAFMGDGTPLDACVFSESTYTHPDPDLQALGRSILDAHEAVVLIPRAPLALDTTYTVSLTVDGQAYTWSFAVAPGFVGAIPPAVIVPPRVR